jgi:hypothetical protein
VPLRDWCSRCWDGVKRVCGRCWSGLRNFELGEQRKRALWRIWAALWLAVFGYVLGIVLGIVALIWAVADLLVSVVFNRDGLSSDSMPARVLQSWFEWQRQLSAFVTTGAGGMIWFPRPSQR